VVVAATKVHWANGFFANWTGQQKGEGIEFHLLALGVAVAIMIAGEGMFSVDRAVTA
jgi:putative oxidoreductase